MNSWDLMTKSINTKNSSIIDDYIKKKEKNDVLILGSPKNLNAINQDYKPSKTQLREVLDMDDEYVKMYPQNWAYRMQGGKKTGSAIYKKKLGSILDIKGAGPYRMRESTKRFLGGQHAFSASGAIDSQFTKRNDGNEIASKSKPFGTMLGDALKYLLWDLPKKFGGAELSAQQKAYVEMVKKQQKKPDYSAKMELKDEQMLEQKLNPLDKKEIARRKQLSKLTDKQKMTYMKMQNKKGKEIYDKQVKEYAKKGEDDRRYNEEREWRDTQKSDRQEDLDYKAMVKRQAEEAAKEEADKPWYDKLGDLALEKGIPALTKLIPVKELQAPAEKLLKMGVDKMRGNGPIRPATDWNKRVKAHMKKNKQTLHQSSKALAKRKPSSWNLKVKEYMAKTGSSLKETLQALKK